MEQAHSSTAYTCGASLAGGAGLRTPTAWATGAPPNKFVASVKTWLICGNPIVCENCHAGMIWLSPEAM